LKFDPIAASVLKNVPISPAVTVRVLDAFGNLTAASDVITIQSAQSVCTVKGTLSVAAASGVATFPDLEIAGKASGCTLSATSGTLATGISNPFNAE
jgi:hypothetical protein